MLCDRVSRGEEQLCPLLLHRCRNDNKSSRRKGARRAGNFQELTDEERKAVELLGEIGPLQPSGTALQGEQAKRIADLAVPLQAIMDKLRAEVAVLTQELKFLTSDD